MARLAAQRLEQEGIVCSVRPVGVGPGGWGFAANLPYALEVRDEDTDRARDILELLPEDLASDGPGAASGGRRTMILVVLVVAAMAVVMGLADAIFERIFR
jgi:hypothetical protein